MKKYYVLFLLLISIDSYAWDRPETAVSELVNFDLNGGRLTSSNWEIYTTKYLTNLPKDYGEPGWDTVTIVNSYRISHIKCLEKLCKVEVEFELFPTSSLKPGPFIEHPKGGIEKVVYIALKSGASWKVQAAQTESELIGPHISVDTYKNL